MNLKTHSILDPVVCYDRYNPQLDDFNLSTYVMPGPVEDLDTNQCLTDSVFAPPKAEKLEVDRGYMICYERGPHGHRPTPYLVIDGEALGGLEEFNDTTNLPGVVGLTDCVWLAPGTVEMCL